MKQPTSKTFKEVLNLLNEAKNTITLRDKKLIELTKLLNEAKKTITLRDKTLSELTKQRNETKKTVTLRDKMLNELTKQGNELIEGNLIQKHWLSIAKKDAGYSDTVPFDKVWAETLALVKLVGKERRPKSWE